MPGCGTPCGTEPPADPLNDVGAAPAVPPERAAVVVATATTVATASVNVVVAEICITFWGYV